MTTYTTTMYRRAERVRSKIKETYSLARQFHEPHTWIVERLKSIRASADYLRLTSYYKGAAEEAIRSEGERMYDHLEWRHCVDGRWILPSEMPEGGYQRIERSAHVYKADPKQFY